MSSVVAGAAWLAFLAVSGVVLWHQRSGRDARQAVHVLLGVVVLASFTAGFSRRSLWPFDSWPVFHYALSDSVTVRGFVAVDADGAEYAVDVRAFEPMAGEELLAWFGSVFPMLEDECRDEVGAYLHGKANLARAAVRAGRGIENRHVLPWSLTAPRHFLHRRFWHDPTSLPDEPFVELRYVIDSWDVLRGRDDSSAFLRRVLYQYRVDP